jgi:PAS domain S-box-containing protein
MTAAPGDTIGQLRRELYLARERESLLMQIHAATRIVTDPAEITYSAARLLGEHLCVQRCAYAEVEDDQEWLTLVGNFVDGLAPMTGRYRLRQFSDSAWEMLTAGHAFVVDDAETDGRCRAQIHEFREASVRAMIAVPLLKEDRLTAILGVHSVHPRLWKAQDISLVSMVANRCWESIERSRALRALEADREALRRKSEESERQHAELKTIYDTAPIGLAYFDLEGYHYMRLNERQAAFFGLKPTEVVGRTLTEMAPIPGLRELFDQVAQGNPVVNYPLEGTLATDLKEYRYWTVNYFPVYGVDGTIQGITAASQEITKQKMAEKALLQNEKLAAAGRLAASVAHEINNPLEAVTNLLYLARATEDPEDIHKLLSTAEDEVRRISAITMQTLRFHRQSSSPQAVDSGTLMQEILNVYQWRLRNSQTEACTRLRAQRPIRCFEGEIRQVLANLIANALDAMGGSAGSLMLRTREATHWPTGERGLVFTVADTGSGIGKETMPRLFEPFFTTKGTIGTGLGLWVSQEIVNRHRGTLRLRSSQSGKFHGTVFTLFLPFDAAVR